MAYQGPNVSVTQTFLATPPATAIENLPPAGIGTAYDVFSKEFLGNAHGIESSELLWGANDVIWNESVIGDRLYNFYPVTTYASTPFGDIALDVTKSSTGVTVTKDQQYVIPGTEQVTGICQAFIPYYNKNLGTGAVQILAAQLDTVVAAGASLATSKIQAGQQVIAGNEGTAGSFVLLGTVAAVGSDETKIKLAQAYSGPVSFNTLIIGVSTVGGDGAFTNKSNANCIYDPNADFIASKIKVGDIVNIQSIALSTTLTYSATVTSVVNKNLIQFNTIPGTAGKEDKNYYAYYPKNGSAQASPTSTVAVTTYNITRLVGFSQNYGYQDIGTGIPCVFVSTASFKVTLASNAPLLSKGDFITMSALNATASNYYAQIDTVTTDVTHQIYTTTTAILKDDGAAYVNGNFVHAWHPLVTSNVSADFRAVRSQEHMVLHRIASPQDIVTAWCKDDVISPYNELAYAMSIALATAGGNVCYGVNVNSTSANLAQEYAEAMEELKMIEAYSHFFCTTDAGVNALASPYCLEQSDPYEAHERIAVLSYDQQDVYLQGVGSGTISSSGVITISSGSMNLPVIGVSKGDVVEIYNASGVLQETVDVMSTPAVTTPTTCNTDGINSYSAATMTFKFMSNRKDDQAIKIASLGIGDRRVAIVWPGWFNANIGTTAVTLPPYYITAAIAGMDSSNKPAQSFTNKNFSIPGVSNIQLNTSSYFRKAQLDVIGGGGIDIMIQDGSISQVIRSRHDLTTNMDAVEYRERSITKQADVAAKTLRSAINPYVGKYNITTSLISFIGQVCSIVASTLVKNGVVANLSTGSIARDANIADKINIAVTTTVFVAGNYYDIQMLIVSR